MLKITGLSVEGKKQKTLIKQISFDLKSGKCIGLTGASGSGKTTLIKSIMGILDESCRIVSGDITLDGVSLPSLTAKKQRELCGTVLGFIPQNPMTAFYRYSKIGKQMEETFCVRLKLSRKDARQLSESTLKSVNMSDTNRILNSYPDQLSGGMLQRITMAILLGLKPRYILADEPTSALDEDNRAYLLKLFIDYPEDAGILFLSHDVTALKTLCKEILVMENGQIIERADTNQLFTNPTQNWTKQFVSYANSQEGSKWAWTEL